MKDDEEEKRQDNDVQPVREKKKLELPFVEYKRLSNLLVLHVRQHETRQRKLGMRQQQLVNWLVQQRVDAEDLQSTEEITQAAKVTRLIIQRLLKVDHVLLEIKQKPKPADDGERLLYVHPNYSIEDGENQDLAEVDGAEAEQPGRSSSNAAATSSVPRRARSRIDESEQKEQDDVGEEKEMEHLSELLSTAKRNTSASKRS